MTAVRGRGASQPGAAAPAVGGVEVVCADLAGGAAPSPGATAREFDGDDAGRYGHDGVANQHDDRGQTLAERRLGRCRRSPRW